jgi:short-subunit dehydrogenase
MDLSGKVVVVTGGSAGLGEQICYAAASKGAIVVSCARRMNLLQKVRKKCLELGAQGALAFTLDIADPANVQKVTTQIFQEVGTVDVLVNNAGFGLFEYFIDTDMEVARNMFNVNVLGMMTFTQQIAVKMAEQKYGHIINVASMAGKMATAKSTIYSATKFAVLGFSNALRLELKPLGIAVTTVNPGPIKTNFFDIADPQGTYLAAVDRLVLDPVVLADEIVHCMGTSKREINRPLIMEGAARFYALFPHLGDLLASKVFDKK